MNLAYVFEHGDPVLIAVFLLLIAMSLASWAIIFRKTGQLRAEQAAVRNFQGDIMARPDWFGTLSVMEAKNEAVSHLVREAVRQHALLPSDADRERREKILSTFLAQMLDKIRIRLDSGLTVLASVGSSAPFIGLFGTVWGIYGALTRIAAEGNASLNVVAGPMGEALVATAVGLFAAIPAVLAYNAFVRQHRVLVQDLRHIAEQITLHLTLPEAKTIALVHGGK